MGEFNYLNNKYKLNVESKEEAIKEMRLLRKKYHPDNLVGNYEEDGKYNYEELGKDLAILRSGEENLQSYSIANFEKKYELAEKKHILSLKKINKKQSKILKEDLHNSNISLSKTINRKYKSIKITSTSISSVLTGIFFIPTDFIRNSMIYSFMETSFNPEQLNLFIMIIWLFFLNITVVIWIVSKIEETKIHEFTGVLESETSRDRIMQSFVREIGQNITSNSDVIFTKEKLIEYIRHYLDVKKIYKVDSYINSSLPISTTSNKSLEVTQSIESAVDLMINRYSNDEVIKKLPKNGIYFGDRYKLLILDESF